VWLRALPTSTSGVLSPTSAPPFTPPSGPKAMTQSTAVIASRSCAITAWRDGTMHPVTSSPEFWLKVV